MKLSKPIYYVKPGAKWLSIQLDFADIRKGKALNMSGYSWSDHGYGIFKGIISRFQVIVTDTDLIGHSDYIAKLKKSQTVVVYVGRSPASASKKRQRKVAEKLKAAGIKVIYRASEASMLKYLESRKAG